MTNDFSLFGTSGSERKAQNKQNDTSKKKKKNHDKETPETFNIFALAKHFFEAAAKEKLPAYQRKPKY